MEKKFNSVKYKNDYNREHYARLSINVPIEDKDKIESFWKSRGFKSFNAYVNELIRRDMNEEGENAKVNVGKIENQDGGTIQIG